MLISFLWLLLATVFVQVPNLLGIHERHTEGLELLDAAKIAFFTLPLTYLATTGFTLYYGRAEQHFSYPAMVIYAHIAALIIGFAIQVGFLKTKDTNFVEIAGLVICAAGLLISVYSKPIAELFRGG